MKSNKLSILFGLGVGVVLLLGFFIMRTYIHNGNQSILLSSSADIGPDYSQPRAGESVKGLQAILTPVQTSYKLGDSIKILCTLKNVGSKPFRIFAWYKPLQPPPIVMASNSKNLLSSETKWRWPIKDSKGKRVTAKVESTLHGAYNDEELIILQPGQEWSIVEDLNNYYILNKSEKYLVRAVYYTDRAKKSNFHDEWVGEVVSKYIEVEIK